MGRDLGVGGRGRVGIITQSMSRSWYVRNKGLTNADEVRAAIQVRKFGLGYLSTFQAIITQINGVFNLKRSLT